MIRSPIVYSGSKFSLLKQLLPLFPKNIDTFYDVFCGSCTVSLNVVANHYKCNDICKPLIDLYNYFKTEYQENKLQEYIEKYDLYNIKDEDFYKLRDLYNSSKDPLLLYILSRCSFNHMIRFNSKNEFNVSFGNWFTINRKYHFDLDIFKFKNKDFYSQNFDDFLNAFEYKENDFVYLDPPYLITNANYNPSWTEKEEMKLLDFCSQTSAKFGISNVFEHKGRSNELLKEFAKEYNVYYLNKSYHAWNNASKNKSDTTVEVYICNYEITQGLEK